MSTSRITSLLVVLLTACTVHAADYGVGIMYDHPDGAKVDANTNSGQWAMLPKFAYTNAVLWFGFSENTVTNYDMTTNRNNGVESSDPVHMSAVNGNAFLEFDKSDDDVTASHTLTYPFTLSAWAVTDENNATVISTGDSGGTRYTAIWSNAGYEWGVLHFNGTVDYLDSGVSANDGGWHHVAAVYENSSSRQIYIDGEYKGQDTSDRPGITFDRTAIGVTADSTPVQRFGGGIDIPMIFNRAISPAEVAELYTHTLTNDMGLATAADLASDAALIMHFDYPEDAGMGHDSSTNLNHGTVDGAVQAVINSNGYEGVVYFDGADDKMTIPDADSLDMTDALTIAFWYKRTGNDQTGCFIACGDGVDGNTKFRWEHSIYSPRTRLIVHKSLFSTAYVQYDWAIPNEEWHHHAVTYQYVADNTSVGKYYVDGACVATNSTMRGPMPVCTADWWVGRRENSADWVKGNLDELRIYDTALSGTAISNTLYEAVKANYGH